jgi:hypothetical protein
VIIASLPWHDWQFWAVTVVAAGGLLVALRPFLPRGLVGGRRDGRCPACPNSGGDGARPKRTELTVGGRSLD